MSRRRRHEDHEEHENHERWLVSYADMMTLLMALFLMLYALSQLDLAKFETFQIAFQQGVGKGVHALPGPGDPTKGNPSEEQPGDPSAKPNANPTPDPITDAQGHPIVDRAKLEQLKEQVDAAVAKAGLQGKVSTKVDPRGLIVSVTSGVLFDSGNAKVRPQGAAILVKLAPALQGVGNELSVEGHTDDVPISSTIFPSNWELSTARATSVLQWLRGHGHLDDRRLSATGFGDARPIVPNTNSTNRATNRRVEIVVHAPPAVLSVDATATASPAPGGHPAPAGKPTVAPSPKGPAATKH